MFFSKTLATVKYWGGGSHQEHLQPVVTTSGVRLHV